MIMTVKGFFSISNAADALHVTQPTLSRQIKELEDELDTILFHQGSREIQLTDDGQYLYNRAIEILALVKKLKITFENQIALLVIFTSEPPKARRLILFPALSER